MLGIGLVTIYFKCKILSLVMLGICPHLLQIQIVCPCSAYVHIYLATLGLWPYLFQNLKFSALLRSVYILI